MILELYSCVSLDIHYNDILNWIDMSYSFNNKRVIIHLVHWFAYYEAESLTVLQAKELIYRISLLGDDDTFY